jgi:hypothetical protein
MIVYNQEGFIYFAAELTISSVVPWKVQIYTNAAFIINILRQATFCRYNMQVVAGFICLFQTCLNFLTTGDKLPFYFVLFGRTSLYRVASP